MAATVEGTFRLIDRASGTLNRIEQRARAADRAITKLGLNLDKLDRRLKRTAANVQVLSNSLDRLSRVRATPRVELEGAAQMATQLAALNTALNALQRNSGETAGSLTTVSRSAKGAATNLGTVSGQAKLLRSRFLLLGAAAVALSPVILQLAGAVSALVSSLTYAIGGAGVVGGGFLGAFVVGIGSTVAIAKSALQPMEEYRKAVENLNKATASGDPRKIQEAANAVNRLARERPGLARLSREIDKTKEAWQNFTTVGMRERFYNFAVNWLQTTRRALRLFRGDMDRNATATYRALEPIRTFIESRQFRRFFHDLSVTWQQSIGPAMKGALGYLKGFMNLITYGLPEVRRMSFSFEQMGKGFDRWSRGGGGREAVRDMIASFREWRGLLASTWDLLKAIFIPSRAGGDSLVASLAGTFREWTAALERDPGSVRRWFDDVTSEVSNLADALAKIIGQIAQLANALRPLTNVVSSLVGGLGLPGLALIAGGGLMGRGFLKGRGMRAGLGGAGGTAAAPVVAGGAGGVRGFGQRFGGPLALGAGTAAAYGGAQVGGTGGAAVGGLASGALLAGMVGLGPLGIAAGGLLGAFGGLLSARGAQMDQSRAEGAAAGTEFVTGLGTASGPGGALRQIRALRAERNRVLSSAVDPRWAGIPGDERSQEKARATADLLDKEIEARRQLLPMLRQERRTRAAILGADRGSQAAMAFGRYERKFGAERAFNFLTQDTMGGIDRFAGRDQFPGARAVAQSALAAAREAARQNPKLEGEYEKLRKRINAKFDDIGHNVVITGTRVRSATAKDWPRIREAIAEPMERANRRTQEAMTGIQRAAIGALVDMGFSRPAAVRLVKGADTSRGGPNVAAGTRGSPLAGPPAPAAKPGSPMSSTLPTGPFGDAWGADSHSRAAGSGARGQASGLMGASGHLGGYADLASMYGLSVSSGLRPGSLTATGNQSYHASGNALDLAGPPQQMGAFARAVAAQYGGQLEELIYSPLGWSIKNGKRVPAYAVDDHWDHVHIADTKGGVAGGLPGLALSPLALGRQSTDGRVPDVLAALAYNAMATGMEKRVNDRMGGGGLGRLPGMAPIMGTGSTSAAGSYDKSALAQLWVQAGGAPGMANLMAAVALAESGGNPTITNSIGATGLWQIMWPVHSGTFKGMNPKDPLDNARMAVSILGTQGISAWEAYTKGMHRQFMGDGWGMPKFGGWFGGGGTFTADRPTYIGVGERGRETVTVAPAGVGGKGGGIHIDNLTINGGEDTYNEVMRAFRDLTHELTTQGPGDD